MGSKQPRVKANPMSSKFKRNGCPQSGNGTIDRAAASKTSKSHSGRSATLMQWIVIYI